MIGVIRNVLILLSSLNALSAQATESLCQPCPKGTTPVSIAFWSAEVYDGKLFQSSFAPDYFYSRPGGIEDLGSHRVEGFGEIRQKVIEIANRCKRIKFLFIASHGANGLVAIGDETLDSSNVSSVLGGLDCAMAKGAAVEFGGCNVGRGCRGDDFMVETARLLLPKGGSVKAPTHYATGLPGTPRFSLNLTSQILVVGAGYTNPLFWVAPRTGEECRDYLWDEYSKIVNLKHELDFCDYSSERNLYIDGALTHLRKSGNSEFDRGERRQNFDADHAKKAFDYAAAFEYAVTVRERLAAVRQKLTTCDSSKFPGYGPAPAAGVFKSSVVQSAPPPATSPKGTSKGRISAQ